MHLLNLIASTIALASTVCGQTTRYCDPLTSICYSSYTNAYGISYRIAIPEVSQAPFDLIFQIVAPIEHQWVGHSFRGRMTYSPLAVGWPNGNNVVFSSRWATGYNVPQPYSGAVFTPLRGTGANSTSWTLTVRCRGCSSWSDGGGATVSLNPVGSATFAWSQSFSPVLEPASSTSLFNVHDSHGTWTHDLNLARSSSFDAWVANNLLSAEPSSTSTSIPVTTTSTTRVSTSTTLVISTTSGTAIPAIPTSCPGVAAQRYASQVAPGWRAVKIAGGLTTPRGILIDNAGRILVVENGKGITAHTLSANGCIASSRTLIAQTNLNHGIALSPDGRTLYASSSTMAWRWTYDSNAGTVGASTVVVNGMSNAGHITRTLAIPKNRPNLLVVSCGSNGNLDMPSGNMATQRAVVKVFDMSSVPGGGYNYVSGGWQAGYGLRNEVGLAFDANNNLWGVENSSDDMTRTVNGVTTDIHNDNPAEELNYFGDVSVPNTKWYGYPTCFTVWNPAVITDRTFGVGDQIVLAPNNTFNDASCVGRSTPARLSFQAHSAPLDAKFDAQNQNMYVGFHGSWNRQPPTGFKLVVVPFTKGSDGLWVPVAPANSRTGYTDIFWNPDTSRCSATNCFRPVGIAFDAVGRMFITSDASAEGELFLLGPASGGGITTTTSSPIRVTTTSSITTTLRVITTTTTTPRATTTTAAAGVIIPKWGQCGGLNWTGSGTCIAGTTCRYSNDWYSQCL